MPAGCLCCPEDEVLRPGTDGRSCSHPALQGGRRGPNSEGTARSSLALRVAVACHTKATVDFIYKQGARHLVVLTNRGEVHPAQGQAALGCPAEGIRGATTRADSGSLCPTWQGWPFWPSPHSPGRRPPPHKGSGWVCREVPNSVPPLPSLQPLQLCFQQHEGHWRQWTGRQK